MAMAQKIKFTASVVHAIQLMLNLYGGNIPGAKQPNWNGFRFFEEINPGEITNTGNPLTGGAMGKTRTEHYQRIITFYFRGKKIAIVEMEVISMSGDSYSRWKIVRATYSPDTDQDLHPNQWFVYEPSDPNYYR
jgi:hypothetical protein